MQEGHRNNVLMDLELMERYMAAIGEGQIRLLKDHWNEGIAIIEIDNEKKKNAISGKMMADLRHCVSQLETWQQGKAVILCGRGTNFCAGGDLDFARSHSTYQDGFCLSSLMMDALSRLRRLPLVSVAVVNGPTIGGGAEIATQCDFLLICDDAKLGFVHGKLGITTAWGGTTRLVQLVGEQTALKLLLSSKIMSAQECLKIGLATHIVSSSNRLDEALDWLRQYTKHPHAITRAFKLATSVAANTSSEESLEFEKKVFCPLWGAPANKEALEKNIKHVKN